jgi:hypothetical protein
MRAGMRVDSDGIAHDAGAPVANGRGGGEGGGADGSGFRGRDLRDREEVNQRGLRHMLCGRTGRACKRG